MIRIGLYYIITLILTWAVEFAMMAGGGMESRWASVLTLVALAMPLLGNLLTRTFTFERFGDMYIRPQKMDKGTVKVFVAAWLLPIGATILGAVLYFLVNPSMLDLDMNYYTGVYQELYAGMGAEYSKAQIKQALRSQILMNLFLAPCLNIVPAFAGELGWRGYLMPRLMEKFKVPVAVLISGLMWGGWYFPLVMMGQYYGNGYAGEPFLGMAATVVFCLVLGTFLSYLAYRTKSCVASAIAMAVFNSFSSTGVYFLKSADYSPFVGPVPTGIIGGIGFILIAIVSMRKLMEIVENK